jgi:hypothetical protein
VVRRQKSVEVMENEERRNTIRQNCDGCGSRSEVEWALLILQPSHVRDSSDMEHAPQGLGVTNTLQVKVISHCRERCWMGVERTARVIPEDPLRLILTVSRELNPVSLSRHSPLNIKRRKCNYQMNYYQLFKDCVTFIIYVSGRLQIASAVL